MTNRHTYCAKREDGIAVVAVGWIHSTQRYSLEISGGPLVYSNRHGTAETGTLAFIEAKLAELGIFPPRDFFSHAARDRVFGCTDHQESYTDFGMRRFPERQIRGKRRLARLTVKSVKVIESKVRVHEDQRSRYVVFDGQCLRPVRCRDSDDPRTPACGQTSFPEHGAVEVMPMEASRAFVVTGSKSKRAEVWHSHGVLVERSPLGFYITRACQDCWDYPEVRIASVRGMLRRAGADRRRQARRGSCA